MKKFYNWGLYSNRWLWFHVLAGDVGSRFLDWWLILLIAILWEFYEYFFARQLEKERFFYDAFADIAGAVLAAIF